MPDKNEENKKPAGKKILRRILIIFSFCLAAMITGFLIYAEIYYHADSTAKTALASDETVKVEKTGYGWFFDGPSEENALVFYPGAKVEETAYAPLLHRLAAEGMDVCLVKMPFRFAFFGIGKAGEIMQEYSYDHWYAGGHSLGGAMAAYFAADHGDLLDGVILLGAYTSKRLNDHLTEILIYGSEDKIATSEEIMQGRRTASAQYRECRIEGGNHAGFGNYGVQSGDGTARISAEEQQEETVKIIMDFIRK